MPRLLFIPALLTLGTAVLIGLMLLAAPLLQGDVLAFEAENDIYLFDFTRGVLVNFTHTSPARESLPVWSPDGETLGFVSNRDGNYEIYVQALHDHHPDRLPRRLTTNTYWDGPLDWSPDGMQIAMVSSRDYTYDLDIYLLNVQTGQSRVVINNTTGEHDAVWSPDGRWLALASEVGLLLVPSDTVNAIPIRLARGIIASPAWSPDGRSLTFVLIEHDQTTYHLAQIDIHNGTAAGEPLLLAENLPTANAYPQWMPDGNNLLLTFAQGTTTFLLLDTATGDLRPFTPYSIPLRATNVALRPRR
ncbi:MAG: hypothetical protein SF029_08270 [bacterium]|nr:hypothetical protein [bacterium]